MQSDFFPDTDGEILAWSTNFREYIVADASSLGLSAQQVERYVTCQ